MKLVGLENEVADALLALDRRDPVLFYGPTGNGKTLAAWEVARRIADVATKQLNRKVPVIYLQLYPEMTKNSLIGGETIKNGSIVVEEQAILQFGRKGQGAVFIVDECTHTTEPVLLAFNSLIEEPYQTVVGNKIYELDDATRFVFCGNFPDHVGNIYLPTSFGNRVYIIEVKLPNAATLVKIGLAACPSCPQALLDFVADVITKTHEASFPISARNMVMAAKAIVALFDSVGNEVPAVPDKALDKACKAHKICANKLKRALMSTLMANTVSTSTGPEKVKALLWQ